jgi:hypothetical protein
MANPQDNAAQLADVRNAELEYLRTHRHPSRSRPELEAALVGLALSGGGIRAATTPLGLLQALSKMQILPLVDYLSTVSGGGYIGTCLTTLLSLADRELPEKPGMPQPKNAPPPFKKVAGDHPAFDTEWGRFPFRAERRDRRGRLGTDLVAHLRTHGNFLIARRGLFKRDTLRAVGHLLTGITYNVTLFLATLFTLSALGMAIALFLAPALPPVFDASPAASAISATAPSDRPAWSDADSQATRIRQAACPDDSPACRVETRTSMRAESYWDRFAQDLQAIALGVTRAGGMLLAAAVVGLVLTLIVFWWIRSRHSAYVEEGDIHEIEPKAGESEDEAFEVRLLWRIAGLVLLVTAGVTLLARIRYVPWNATGAAEPPRGWLRAPQSLEGADQLSVLLLPLALLLAARITALLIAALSPLFESWTRRMRSLWNTYQAMTIYGWWIMLALVLFPVAVFALHGYRGSVGTGALGSLVVARLLASRRAIVGVGRIRLPPAAHHALLALAIMLVVVLGLVFFGSILVDAGESVGWVALGGVLVILAAGFLIDVNKLSPHYFYRDRLAETYLVSELADTNGRLHTYRDAMEMPLADLHGSRETKPPDTAWVNPSPYHLINAAINLAGSRDLTRKDRKSGYWLFSKLYCGSTHTGFRETRHYRKGETKVARAMSISGAAASSAAGVATFFAQAFASVVFNVRLGYWMRNPKDPGWRKQELGMFWPLELWREVTMSTTERGRLVNLSDGGHTGDNIGIYALLQRRCKVIIACDAERDPDLTFGSFTEALRHAYVDLGVDVDIDLTMIRPDAVTGYSRSHCAVGRIRYPEQPEQASFLVYLKNSLTGDEPEPILNYRAAQPAFPHESTVDQFFDDAQFESYRALGVHLGETTFARWTNLEDFFNARDEHWPR